MVPKAVWFQDLLKVFVSQQSAVIMSVRMIQLISSEEHLT